MPHNGPVRTPFLLLFVLLLTGALQARQDLVSGGPEPFDSWLRNLEAEAKDKGFSDDLIAATLTGLEPLPRVIASDRSQAELVVGFNRYLTSHVSAVIVRRGREAGRTITALTCDVR